MFNHEKDGDVKLQSINPATGEKIKEYEPLSNKDLKFKLRGSESIWEEWSSQSFSRRAELLERLSHNLLSQKEKLSEIITKEMGKPLNQSLKEIEKCALICRYYKEHGQYFLSPREEFLHYKKSYVHYAPLGGVLGIMPWNFPFWQVFRFAIPALFSGNAVFLKHSENVSHCALELERVFIESGWPTGIFTTLLITRSQVERVIADPFIKACSFTGSTRAGKIIATLSGHYLKKTLLELGGSDPYIVLEDADLTRAAESIVSSRLNNSGQSCIAAKRVIAEKSIMRDLTDKILFQLEHKTISRPHYNPDVGPLAKKEAVDNLRRLVNEDIKEGARVLFEKKPSPEDAGEGFYFPITLLGNCSSSMNCAREEFFGPVLPLFEADNQKKALEMANQTNYGLGAALFTNNEELAERWAKNHIRSGSCFINGMVKSNQSLPFGGINQSGWGRELSVEGIREFTNTKTIVICNT